MGDDEKGADAGKPLKLRAQLVEWARSAVPAVAGTLGVSGIVSVLGAGILWVRFTAANIPANQAVGDLPASSLLVTGAVTLVTYLVLGLLAVLVVYLLQRTVLVVLIRGMTNVKTQIVGGDPVKSLERRRTVLENRLKELAATLAQIGAAEGEQRDVATPAPPTAGSVADAAQAPNAATAGVDAPPIPAGLEDYSAARAKELRTEYKKAAQEADRLGELLFELTKKQAKDGEFAPRGAIGLIGIVAVELILVIVRTELGVGLKVACGGLVVAAVVLALVFGSVDGLRDGLQAPRGKHGSPILDVVAIGLIGLVAAAFILAILEAVGDSTVKAGLVPVIALAAIIAAMSRWLSGAQDDEKSSKKKTAESAEGEAAESAEGEPVESAEGNPKQSSEEDAAKSSKNEPGSLTPVLLAVGLVLLSLGILLLEEATWVLLPAGAAAVLGVMNGAVGRLHPRRFFWYGLSVFTSVALFGATLTYSRTLNAPSLEGAALLLKNGCVVKGMWIGESSSRVFLARIDFEEDVQRVKRQKTTRTVPGVDGPTQVEEREVVSRVKLVPQFGHVFWVFRSNVKSEFIGKLRRLPDAAEESEELARNALRLNNSLSPAATRCPTATRVAWEEALPKRRVISTEVVKTTKPSRGTPSTTKEVVKDRTQAKEKEAAEQERKEREQEAQASEEREKQQREAEAEDAQARLQKEKEAREVQKSQEAIKRAKEKGEREERQLKEEEKLAREKAEREQRKHQLHHEGGTQPKPPKPPRKPCRHRHRRHGWT